MLNFIVSVVLALLSYALTTKSELAWVSFCLLMPLAGPLAYLLFGINRAPALPNCFTLSTRQRRG